jgi:LysM repeat protein
MLASLYGYTEDRFRRMNSLSRTESVLVGQKLRSTECICPETTVSSATIESNTTAAKSVEQPPAGIENEVYYRPIRVHTVEKDDTLQSIAQKYNTSPERILELNGMKKGEGIKLNQRLYVQ